MKDIHKLKARVQKLLRQAADREGTPEGDSFYAKAFDLMAAYGLSERDVTSIGQGNTIERRTYDISGAYTDMQAKLLFAIADSLHCTGFYNRAFNSTRVKQATLFGHTDHLARVDALYSLLVPVMMAGARRLHATHLGESIIVTRRSYMTGFATRIGQRLAQSERRVTDTSQAYALALIDDAEQARNALADFAADRGLHLHADTSKRSFDPDAYRQGHEAGDASDIGQQRVRARPALPF